MDRTETQRYANEKGQITTNRANTLERAYSLSLLQILLCSIKVNLGPKAWKLEEAWAAESIFNVTEVLSQDIAFPRVHW